MTEKNETIKTVYYVDISSYSTNSRIIELKVIEKPKSYLVRSESALYGSGKTYITRVLKDYDHIFDTIEAAVIFLIYQLTDRVKIKKSELDMLKKQLKELTGLIEKVNKAREKK